MSKISNEFFEKVISEIVSKKGVYSAVLCVESGDGSISWTGAAGNMNADSQYFIASVTKLYITTLVMLLIEEGKISLEDKIYQYFPDGLMDGIHVLKGVDYSKDITIKHLISNTSGLPDYFFHKKNDGTTFADDLLKGDDILLKFEDTVEYVKGLTPNFEPGKKGKAAYSDTNYEILGEIIENVTGKDIADVFKEYIFDELGLDETYAYKDINNTKPTNFYYKSKELWVPQYIASVPAEGGIVSTANECMIYLKAFFNEKFFPKEKLSEMKQWNLLLPPPGMFYFGVGLEKLFVPRFISPFKKITEILGFWGQTGSFAWYNPDTDLYFTGTTNQINGAGHAAAMKGILKIIKT